MKNVLLALCGCSLVALGPSTACTSKKKPRRSVVVQQSPTPDATPKTPKAATPAVKPAPAAKPAPVVKPKPRPRVQPKARRARPAGRVVKWDAPIAWVDYEAGLAQAKRENKPVLLLVYTNW